MTRTELEALKEQEFIEDQQALWEQHEDNKPVLYAEYIDWRDNWIISNPDRADLPIFYAHDIQAEIAKLSEEYNIVKVG